MSSNTSPSPRRVLSGHSRTSSSPPHVRLQAGPLGCRHRTVRGQPPAIRAGAELRNIVDKTPVTDSGLGASPGIGLRLGLGTGDWDWDWDWGLGAVPTGDRAWRLATLADWRLALATDRWLATGDWRLRRSSASAFRRKEPTPSPESRIPFCGSIRPYGSPCKSRRSGRHPRLQAVRAGVRIAGGIHGQGGAPRRAVRADLRRVDGLPRPAGRSDGQRLDPDRRPRDLGAQAARRLDDPREQHRSDDWLGRRVARRGRRLHHPRAHLPRAPRAGVLQLLPRSPCSPSPAASSAC